LMLIAFALSLVPVTAACSSCQTGSLDGVLVADGSGLSVSTANGASTPVAWPPGYGFREESGRRLLVDAAGSVIGREGDTIEVVGGLGTDDIWHACSDLSPKSMVVTPS
jgi:hypothetical protein